MLTKPRWLLHLEGACILALTVVLYHAGHFRWWVFAVLLLAPDLAMLGYLANAKIGAPLYNLLHTEAGPVLLLVASVVVPLPGLRAFRFDLARASGHGPDARLRLEISHAV